MAEALKLGIVLMVVAVIAAGSLGFVNDFTAPLIARQKEEARLLGHGNSCLHDHRCRRYRHLRQPHGRRSRQPLCPGGRSAVPGGRLLRGRPRGLRFHCLRQGLLQHCPDHGSMRYDGIVTGSQILFQQETPGLGANVVNPDRLIGSFSGREAAGLVLEKDGGDIDAITGSTITSRAVTLSVRKGLEAMEDAGLFTEGGYSL